MIILWRFAKSRVLGSPSKAILYAAGFTVFKRQIEKRPLPGRYQLIESTPHCFLREHKR
jgi:hypothetical protein